MKTKKNTLLLLVCLFILTSSLYSTIIKIGSIAPANSPWDKAIKKMGREWKKISGGKVQFKVYSGGTVGDEADMIRKMRIGKLGGAALTNMGITRIYQDAYVLNTPLLITTEKELEYVLEKMKPLLEKGIEKKGFKVVIWSLTGWINFFTKKKVVYPKDLKKHKISFTRGMPKMEQAWKKAGYHVVPNDLKDLMMALQSGMVDACYMPPLIAASGQYFAQAPNMCALKIAPLLGGIVLTERIWKRIPEKNKKQMMDVAKKISDELYSEIIRLEQDAINTMKKNDLVINQVPADAVEEWKAASAKGMDVLVGKAFSKEIYDRIVRHLNEYRKLDEN
ncbi:MAG: TRAP transporter substrate-binding protein DctP [Candidatus Aminicenantes bacterium]|nr:TRAP transporter substrate-binding protein DctP [Candidatus Aminicenantes bacterium]